MSTSPTGTPGWDAFVNPADRPKDDGIGGNTSPLLGRIAAPHTKYYLDGALVEPCDPVGALGEQP